MATLADTVLSDVLDLIRDPNATMCATNTPPTTASGQAFVYAMMTAAQLFISLGERLITATSTIALTTNNALYDLLSIADFGGKVISCRVAGVGVIDGPVDYQALGRASFTWLTDTDSGLPAAVRAWAPIGTDKIAFVPVFASAPPTVSLEYMQATNTLSSGVNIAIPDDTAEHLARLTELLCLLKTRQINNFDEKLKSLASAMGRQDILRPKEPEGTDDRESSDGTSGSAL